VVDKEESFLHPFSIVILHKFLLECFSAVEYAIEHRLCNLTGIVQRTTKVEELLRERRNVVLRSRNELHEEELSYGRVLRKSLQIDRNLEKMKNKLEQSKDTIRRTVSNTDRIHAKLGALNMELRTKLQDA